MGQLWFNNSGVPTVMDDAEVYRLRRAAVERVYVPAWIGTRRAVGAELSPERGGVLVSAVSSPAAPEPEVYAAPVPQPVKSFFRRLSKECGFAVSSHRFRHTFATILMNSPDRNLPLVKGLLGHSSVSTTMEYIDINMRVAAKTLETELSLYTDRRQRE